MLAEEKVEHRASQMWNSWTLLSSVCRSSICVCFVAVSLSIYTLLILYEPSARSSAIRVALAIFRYFCSEF